MKNRRPRKRAVTIILIVLAVVSATGLGMYFLARSTYDSNFRRQDPIEPFCRTLDEFPGLDVEQRSFASDKGQRLAGYLYSKADTQPKGVVVLVHGFGTGGQCAYMDVADYFTSNGYLVFAYDATGFGASEGDSTVGEQQGIIDLDHALDYVETSDATKDYPIVLWGHSWGAYCASCALIDHPEVKAVVSVSGYDSSASLDDYKLDDGPTRLLSPFSRLIDRQRFGAYADYTSLAGFAGTSAGVMVVQSADDDMVPESLGYDLYYAKYQDDSRFAFKLYQDRQHLFIYHTDAAREYATAYYDEELDYFDSQGVEVPTPEQAAAYVSAHPFDKKAGFAIDLDLMGQMRDFYDRHCD
jgi:pimeloyl-ACP methyl ester carboxylesterase